MRQVERRMKRLGLTAVLVGALSATGVKATASDLDVTASPVVPGVTQAEIKQLFGNRLDQTTRAESLLLFAQAMDATSSASPFAGQRIGVPYLVGDGAGFWAMSLATHDRSIETLVNNAFLLLFMDASQENMPERSARALELLEAASDRGYWPADIYLAEHYFDQASQHLPAPFDIERVRLEKIGKAFEHYLSCAQVGFAPCQLKLGFMYLVAGSLEAGVPLLQAAIEIVRQDARYLDSVETMKDVVDALDVLTSPHLDLRETEMQLYEMMKAELSVNYPLGEKAVLNGAG